jgi:hypothetical protein
MEDLPHVADSLLASIGANNIKYEKFDEQLICDQVNANLAKQQEKIDNS